MKKNFGCTIFNPGNKKMRWGFVFLVLFTLQVSAQNVWGDLKMGPSAVGFKVVHLYDYSRTFKNKLDTLGNPYKGERARPIQVCIWSPVAGSPKPVKGKELLFQDYVALWATEFTGGKLNDSIRKAGIQDMIESGFLKEKIEKNLKNVMYARKNEEALPTAGKYPLIIYASSWSASSDENYVLYEFLASHGYVVVACPSMGATSRAMTGDMAGIVAQVEDLQFITNYACNLPYVDVNKIGTAGFSWGGLTDVMLQQKNNKIAAVISYDGSIGAAGGVDHFNNFLSSSFSKMDVPFMYMARKSRGGNPFYDKLNYSDAYLLTFQKNNHRDFSCAFIKTINEYKNDTVERMKMKNYEWQCIYSLNFFNAYIKGDKEGLKFINADPKEHGIADTVITMISKKAKPMPPNQDYFMRVFRRDGFQKAKELYLKVHAEDPGYDMFSETRINNLGYEFYKKDKMDEAIEILELNTIAYPNSANAYDSLGDVYQKKGDKEKAIENYKKAVAIDPKYVSKEKLEKLMGSK